MHFRHIDLVVPDMGAATRFFSEHFGFRVLRADDRFALLMGGNGFVLALSPTGDGQPPAYPSGFHIGFFAEAEHEIGDLYDRMAAAGVEIVHPPAPLAGGGTGFYCRGAGVLVEVAWRPPSGPGSR